MTIKGYLKLSSFTYIGSIGARHFYGKIVYYDEQDKRQEIEIERLLSLKSARELNKIDEGRFLKWEKGMKTDRFDTEDDVIATGIKLFKSKFPDGLLFRGDNCYCDAQPVIYWPKRLDKVAKRINELAAELETLHDDDLVSANFKKFDKLMKHV